MSELYFHHLPLHNENLLTSGLLISKDLTLQLMNIGVSTMNTMNILKEDDIPMILYGQI